MADIRTPTNRTCTRCGRTETWNDDATTWEVDNEVGDVYCVHDWDITGEFKPVEE